MPTANEWQFMVGCFIGAGAGISLSKSGILLTRPETRWQFVTAVTGFAGVWGLICALWAVQP